MIHFEVGPAALQQFVPFELDLRDGRAFVSLVAFTLSKMRPRFGGRIAAWLLKPISTHDFLNIRTYVRMNGETGIYFLAEWLSSRLSVILGPRAFGLPYRLGRIEYSHNWESPNSRSSSSSFSDQLVVSSLFLAALTSRVADTKTGDALVYEATLNAARRFHECAPGSFSEWLMERYTAFTGFGNKRRFFRVWHQPWPQVPVQVCIRENNLLKENWSFFHNARLVGANFSPGVTDVWMGWPYRVGRFNALTRF